MSASVSMPRTDALVCVAPDQVDQIWPHVRAFIETAFQKGRGDENPDVIEAEVRAGRSLLWVVWDGAGLLAAATTRIIEAPMRKYCLITSCGGRELPRWLAFITDLENYARGEGCAALRIEGREGWAKMFPAYHQPYIVLEKVL